MEIAIIGGGITGLSTALALQKMGLSSTVYERAASLNEIGAGVWLQPNAVKIMDWLGIKEAIHAQGMELDRMEITNKKLVPFKKIKSQVVQDKEGNKTIAIHRGRLQKILYEEVLKSGKVELGKSYQSHEVTPEGIQINFEEGNAPATILLGADGIHSNVRKSLFPSSALRSAKQVCWRGIASISLPAELQQLGREVWGDQVRFGFSQISATEVYWFAVAKEASVIADETKDLTNYLHTRFQRFHPIVKEIIQHTEATQIHQAVMKDVARLEQWHKGNTCLMGDAAHATTPNMGQGACQGIEDAFYMSQALHQHSNSQEAFEAFDTSRRKKVDYIVNNSWRFGQMAHSKLGQALMGPVMKLTPEKVMSQQMKALFEVEGI